MLDERHDGVACNNIYHNRYVHTYDKAESVSSDSTTASSIPNEVLLEDDGEMLQIRSEQTPSYVADSDHSWTQRRKKKRKASVLRTNDGTLAKQQWIWDQPYQSGDYWDSMRDSITSNRDPQPLADDHSDGYIADRLHWDSMEAGPACPCSPIVMDSEPRQDLGDTPEPDLDCNQSADAMVLEPTDIISIDTVRQQPGNTGNAMADTGPCIPLEDTGLENTGYAFPPSPPQLTVKSEDIRPEDAMDCSVPSLDDLREGKLDTMEDRSETLGNFWEIRILSQDHCLSHRLRTYSMVRDDTGWVLRMYVHARRAYIKTICIVIRMPFCASRVSGKNILFIRERCFCRKLPTSLWTCTSVPQYLDTSVQKKLPWRTALPGLVSLPCVRWSSATSKNRRSSILLQTPLRRVFISRRPTTRGVTSTTLAKHPPSIELCGIICSRAPE